MSIAYPVLPFYLICRFRNLVQISNGRAAFLSFVREAMERSDFQANVSVEPTDRIVTLSTCAYVFDNARYVIHARLSPLA